jgi:hypothetical protein
MLVASHGDPNYWVSGWYGLLIVLPSLVAMVRAGMAMVRMHGLPTPLGLQRTREMLVGSGAMTEADKMYLRGALFRRLRADSANAQRNDQDLRDQAAAAVGYRATQDWLKQEGLVKDEPTIKERADDRAKSASPPMDGG